MTKMIIDIYTNNVLFYCCEEDGCLKNRNIRYLQALDLNESLKEIFCNLEKLCLS